MIMMSDLVCTKCGETASYADANIADIQQTCGGTYAPKSGAGTHVGGDEHDWVPNDE